MDSGRTRTPAGRAAAEPVSERSDASRGRGRSALSSSRRKDAVRRSLAVFSPDSDWL